MFWLVTIRGPVKDSKHQMLLLFKNVSTIKRKKILLLGFKATRS